MVKPKFYFFFLIKQNEYNEIRVHLILSFDCCYKIQSTRWVVLEFIGNVLYTSWTLDSQSGELGGRRAV
jgi:hypothetical protein